MCSDSSSHEKQRGSMAIKRVKTGTGITQKEKTVLTAPWDSETVAAFKDSMRRLAGKDFSFEGIYGKPIENLCRGVLSEAGFDPGPELEKISPSPSFEEDSREDYARRILVYLNQFRHSHAAGNYDMAYQMVFDLARLAQEAADKFSWEGLVLHGEKFFDELPDEATCQEVLTNLVKELTGVDSITIACVRQEAIERFKALKFNAPGRLVDSALPRPRMSSNGTGEESQGSAVVFEKLERCPEPVDGLTLVREILQLVKRFLVTGEGAALTIALFVLFTYVHDCFDVNPRLAFISAVKRCGKTRALELLCCLVNMPLPASNVTPATLFRSIEKYFPTLLIDELDSFSQGQ